MKKEKRKMLEAKSKVAFLEQVNQIEVPEQFLEQMQQYEEMIVMYRCAIREVQTKLEILNDALSVRYKRNPINFIKSRIKSPVSIMNKLERRGLEISLESIEKNLNDVAGIRVVCHFVDDIYDVAHMLAIQDDLKILQIKDYIKNPKENGYRSYHMIVEVPVFLPKRKKPMRVEVQIRTIAMDFWASLDHQLRYKKDIENSEEILKELKECAEIISSTDYQMQKIRKKIEKVTEGS